MKKCKDRISLPKMRIFETSHEYCGVMVSQPLLKSDGAFKLVAFKIKRGHK